MFKRIYKLLWDSTWGSRQHFSTERLTNTAQALSIAAVLLFALRARVRCSSCGLCCLLILWSHSGLDVGLPIPLWPLNTVHEFVFTHGKAFQLRTCLTVWPFKLKVSTSKYLQMRVYSTLCPILEIQLFIMAIDYESIVNSCCLIQAGSWWIT